MTNKVSATQMTSLYDYANEMPEARQHHQTNDALNTPQHEKLIVAQATEDMEKEVRKDEPTVLVKEESTDQTSLVMTSDDGRRCPLRKHKAPIRITVNALTKSRNEDEPTVREKLSGPEVETRTNTMRSEMVTRDEMKGWQIVDGPKKTNVLHTNLSSRKRETRMRTSNALKID